MIVYLPQSIRDLYYTSDEHMYTYTNENGIFKKFFGTQINMEISYIHTWIDHINNFNNFKFTMYTTYCHNMIFYDNCYLI